MNIHAEDVRIISSEPASAESPAEADVSPGEAGLAASEHPDCPYCGDTGRDQVRKYRFCGHDAA